MYFLDEFVCGRIVEYTFPHFKKKYSESEMEWLYEWARVTDKTPEFILTTKCGETVEYLTDLLKAKKTRTFVDTFERGNFFVMSLNPSVENLNDEFLPDHTWIIIKEGENFISLASYIFKSTLKTKIVDDNYIRLLTLFLKVDNFSVDSDIWETLCGFSEKFTEEQTYRLTATSCSIVIPDINTFTRRIFN